MRILFFSDVHANLEALQAVLADATRRGFDSAICLGDSVGYGADPEGCVRVVSQTPGGAAVLGNHDAAVVDPAQSGYLNPAAQAGVRYSRAHLTEESVDYLRSLPLVIDSGGDFVASHASPHRPGDWLYVLEPVEVRDAFRAITRSIAFIGHTHFPLVHDGAGRMLPIAEGDTIKIQPGVKHIVNVGSVGQPRDGDPRAAYGIFDDVIRVVEVYRVEYDVDTTVRKILEAGLPAMLADRLRLGY